MPAGDFIWMAAGSSGTGFSPTTLFAVTYPTASAPNEAASAGQYTLDASAGDNSATWRSVDPSKLSISMTPTTSCWAHVTGNADLWTADAGYNQDVGIEVTQGGWSAVTAWKEFGRLCRHVLAQRRLRPGCLPDESGGRVHVPAGLEGQPAHAQRRLHLDRCWPHRLPLLPDHPPGRPDLLERLGPRGRGKPSYRRAHFEPRPQDITDLAHRHGAWSPSTEPGEGRPSPRTLPRAPPER